MSPHVRSPRPAQSARMAWLDWIRGLAIVLVVFHHAVAGLVVVHAHAPAWAAAADALAAPYRIPMLMFLSGTLLTRSLRKPRREYVVGKLRHIAWPYLLWTGVIVGFLVVAGNLFGAGNNTLADIPSIVADPRTYTWYLAYLVLYYLIALATTPVVRAAAVPVLLAVSALIHDGDGWTRLTFLLAIFFLGDLAARAPSLWSSWSSRPIPLVLATLALVFSVVRSADGATQRYGLETIIGILGILICGRFVAERASSLPVLSSLVAVGRDSIVYYTAHWIVIALASHVLDKAGVHSATLAIVLLMLCGFAVPWALVHLRRRWNWVGALFEFPRLTTSSRQPAAV